MADLSTRDIAVSVEADGGETAIGQLVAYSCTSISETILNAASDDDALAILIATSMLPGWFPKLTLRIDADQGDIAEAVDALVRADGTLLWHLTFATGAVATVRARAARAEGFSVQGPLTVFKLSLTPLMPAEVQPANVGSLAFDFSESNNAVGGVTAGVI